MGRFDNKVVIITGGAAGIGYAAAELFAREGATVCICDVNAEKLSAASISLVDIALIRTFAVDISDASSCKEVINVISSELGHIDILINNAGITSDAQFYKMSYEQFNKVVDTNLKGCFNMSKPVVDVMISQKYGKIINVSSVSAFNGNFGQSNYSASKAGISAMTKVMSRELGKYGINVNAVAPGSIMTDMYAAVPEEIKQKKLQSIPLRRYGNPTEVAKLFAFLASDDASYITGQTITIDGGYN